MNAATETPRYFGSQEYRDDRAQLAGELVDAAKGTNGIVVHDVIERALALDGTEMVNDIVADARYQVALSGQVPLAVLNALVATACATLGVTR